MAGPRIYLSRLALTLAYVRAEPLIHQGRTKSEKDIRQGSDNDKETRVCVVVQGLWDCQDDAIIDIILGNNVADSYKYETMTAFISRWETIKKDKHGEHCHNQWKHVLPFFSLSGRNAMEGSPGRTLSTESSHGR